ncbi:conserved hypothetical protein [Methylocella tundrae]|uniref:Conjugal transfer protein TrbK n=1 Tax=Methylocella tundrae TaxID=227605 RepID=A0A8B6M7X6_METTU|nr:putative entry exclusion protein TrbK-alt [Methylocella tundrae]VTZ23016.1 Conjugative transfer region protein TrbK [Methylocella tundrae]VTZ50415.1 conserved hypothetical protein [Methylocella tundrae]
MRVDTMTLTRLSLVAALAGLLIAAATLHRRADVRAPGISSAAPPADDLSAELRRCAALDPKDAEDPRCRAVWAENRRRFFGKSPLPVATPAPPAASASEGGAP